MKLISLLIFMFVLMSCEAPTSSDTSTAKSSSPKINQIQYESDIQGIEQFEQNELAANSILFDFDLYESDSYWSMEVDLDYSTKRNQRKVFSNVEAIKAYLAYIELTDKFVQNYSSFKTNKHDMKFEEIKLKHKFSSKNKEILTKKLASIQMLQSISTPGQDDETTDTEEMQEQKLAQEKELDKKQEEERESQLISSMYERHSESVKSIIDGLSKKEKIYLSHGSRDITIEDFSHMYLVLNPQKKVQTKSTDGQDLNGLIFENGRMKKIDEKLDGHDPNALFINQCRLLSSHSFSSASANSPELNKEIKSIKMTLTKNIPKAFKREGTDGLFSEGILEYDIAEIHFSNGLMLICTAAVGNEGFKITKDTIQNALGSFFKVDLRS